MTRVWTGGSEPCEIGYSSPRISGEIYECALPLTFDTYSRCSFNCLYCFAVNQKTINGGVEAGKASQYAKPLRCVDPDVVKRLWLTVDGDISKGGINGLVRSLIRRHAPVHWGGLSDPFDGHEDKYRVGLELMKFWRALNYPVVFSTKGILMVKEPWRSVLAGGQFRFQQSIIVGDQKKSNVVDQGCPTVDQRYAAMRALTKEMGAVVTLRLRPIVPGVVSPKDCLDLIERAHECGATGVSTEFFCMESRGLFLRPRYAEMSEVAGFDLFEYYRRQSPHQSGYMRLNPEVKRQYFEPMAALCRKLKMRFASSDMFFKHLNTCVGCCAVYSDDETATPAEGDGAMPWVNRGTLTWAILHAKQRGEVRRYEVDHWLEWAQCPNAGCIQATSGAAQVRSKHKNQTLADVLRGQWNDPKTANSPGRYTYGLLEASGVDDNGDVIYRYRKDRE
jgi:DNA repair photolyase